MAAGGNGLCWTHDPAKARERAEARKRGGRNRRAAKSQSGETVRLRSVEAVQKLVERAVGDSLLLENSIRRSRTLGYLAGVALKVLEIGEMEQRLAALEELSGDRNG